MRLIGAVEEVIARVILGTLKVNEKDVKVDHVVEDCCDFHNLIAM